MSRMIDSVSGKANLGGRFDAGTGGPETVIINPATEQRIGSWIETCAVDVDAAIRERQSLLAEALTREMGKP